MKKRFIVLVDFSEYSGNLIQYTYDWSSVSGSKLVFVHQTIIMLPGLANHETKAKMTKRTNDEALEKLELFVNNLVSPVKNTSYIVSENHLEIILSNLLEEEEYSNLIFTGLKNNGILRKIFLGNTTIQIIDNISNIILAIPKEINTYTHKDIYIAVTEKHPLNLVALHNFLSFIDPKDTRLIFFCLTEAIEHSLNIKNELNELSAIFSDKFSTKTIIYKGKNAIKEIKKVINNKEEEILIVQKDSRLLTDQFFKKILINELVYEGQTPLVILPL